MIATAPNRRLLFWLMVAVVFFLFLFSIRAILLPFVLGIFTAYFLDPAADKLEKHGLSRSMSTMVITVTFFMGLALLMVLIVPILINQVGGLLDALPEYITKLERNAEPWMTRWMHDFPKIDATKLTSSATSVSGMAVSMMAGFIAGLFQSGVAFLNILSLILITPVVAFYLLRDWDHITAKIDLLLPREHANTIRDQVGIIDRTLAGFVRGQLNVCLLLATYYAIGLSLVGLKFGIIIGLTTGFLVIFPYVGLLLGMSVGLGVALFQFETYNPVLAVAAVFISGQIIEGYFVTPRLIGSKVGLTPVWVIFGMLAGGTLFGFVGILLAVPLTAVIGVLLRFALDNYLHSEYYLSGRLIQ